MSRLRCLEKFQERRILSIYHVSKMHTYPNKTKPKTQNKKTSTTQSGSLVQLQEVRRPNYRKILTLVGHVICPSHTGTHPDVICCYSLTDRTA